MDESMTYFNQYPQPPALSEEDRQKTKLTASLQDEYLDALEQYIEELGNFIREIQKQEVTWLPLKSALMKKCGKAESKERKKEKKKKAKSKRSERKKPAPFL